MALRRLQVTIGAVADQPTRFTVTRVPARHIIIESDDGNSNPVFIGNASVTSANGIRLHNSATVPGRMELGPFSGDAPVNINELYVAGTANEIINVLYIGH
jgi:hypothetical protein